MLVRKVTVSPLQSDNHTSFNTHENRPATFRALVTHTVQDRTKSVKRCQFLVILIICVGILGFQAAQCVKKYADALTGTADKYVHVSQTSFPVLTICPTYPYDLDKLRSHGIETQTEIQFKSRWTSNDSQMDVVEFYHDVVLAIEDVVKDVQINAEALINGTNIFFLNPRDTICGKPIFYVKEYYYNGDCFALQLPDCLIETGILEIILNFRNKTDIFIHHEGQFLSPNSRSRVDVDMSHFVKIAINHEVVQLLGDDGSCVNNDVDYDDCMYTKLDEIMMSKVGCTVPWLPEKSRTCVDEEQRMATFEIYKENRRNQKNICPNSCLFTNMYFGPPVTGFNNDDELDVARAYFYFRRDIKTTTEYFLYSILSMVAEIGGYVGLLLGVSLFKLADFNNTCIDWYISKAEQADIDHERKMKRFTNDKSSSLYI